MIIKRYFAVEGKGPLIDCIHGFIAEQQRVLDNIAKLVDKYAGTFPECLIRNGQLKGLRTRKDEWLTAFKWDKKERAWVPDRRTEAGKIVLADFASAGLVPVFYQEARILLGNVSPVYAEQRMHFPAVWQDDDGRPVVLCLPEAVNRPMEYNTHGLPEITGAAALMLLRKKEEKP